MNIQAVKAPVIGNARVNFKRVNTETYRPSYNNVLADCIELEHKFNPQNVDFKNDILSYTKDDFNDKKEKYTYQFYPNRQLKHFELEVKNKGSKEFKKLKETHYHDNNLPQFAIDYHSDGTPSEISLFNKNGQETNNYNYNTKQGFNRGSHLVYDGSMWIGN